MGVESAELRGGRMVSMKGFKQVGSMVRLDLILPQDQTPQWLKSREQIGKRQVWMWGVQFGVYCIIWSRVNRTLDWNGRGREENRWRSWRDLQDVLYSTELCEESGWFLLQSPTHYICIYSELCHCSYMSFLWLIIVFSFYHQF